MKEHRIFSFFRRKTTTKKEAHAFTKHNSDANWAKDKDLILSDKYFIPYRGTNNMNSITISSVGTGKTRGFVKSNLLLKGCNFVVTDVKGDLVNEFAEFYQNKQTNDMPAYEIKVLDLKNPETSANTYNPFQYIHEPIDVVAFATSIADRVKGVDPYWTNAAANLITSIIFFIIETYPKEEWNIRTILEVFNHSVIPDQSEAYATNIEYLNNDSMAKRYYLKVAGARDAEKTWSCIIGEVSVALSVFEFPEILNLTDTDTLEIEKLADEHTILFIVLDDTNKCYDFLAGILYSQIFRTLYRIADNSTGSKLKQHVRFIMDDFANYYIPDIDKVISAARSRNISLQMLLQSESQLYDRYGKVAENLIANCTYVYIGGNDIKTEENIAKRLGLRVKDVQNSRDTVYIMFPEGENIIDAKADYLKSPSYHYLEEFKTTRKVSYSGIKQDYWRDEDETTIDLDLTQSAFNLDDIKALIGSRINIPDSTLSTICEHVMLRRDRYDSNEEQLFHMLLSERFGATYDIHVHYPLREIFDTHVMEMVNSKMAWKMINMHVDFLIDDKEGNHIGAVEIDGSQHFTDANQNTNDRIKDMFFVAADIPLIRISAKDIRTHIYSTVNIVRETLSLSNDAADTFCHHADQQPFDYDSILSTNPANEPIII